LTKTRQFTPSPKFDGRIESSEGGFTVKATVTGQLNCLTGETEGIVISGDYQLSTFTGTMSATYEKSEWVFWGFWQVVDEAPGYSGSGLWDATWVGTSM
jgi:hypothetical protein